MAEKMGDKVIYDELVRSRLPVLPNERRYKFGDMLLIQISFAIATWLLIIGAYVGLSAPFPLALIAMLVGVSIPMAMISPIGKACARWGIDHAFLNRSVAGPIGSIILVFAVSVVAYLGWTSIPVVMFGRAAQVSFSSFGVQGPITSPILWGIVVLAGSSLILWKYTAVIIKLARVITPTVVLLLALMTYKVIATYGFGNILAMVPEGLNPDPWMSFMIGVEIAVGTGFSWVFCYAIYCRLAKSEATAYYGPWLGWGVLWAFLAIPAMLCALVAGVFDPVYVLKDIGGANWTLLYMVFLLLANLFSALCTMYIVSLSLRALWPRLKWFYAVAINWLIVPVIFLPMVYDKFQGFITLIGAVFGPVGAVLVVDLLMKHFDVNLKEIYDSSPKSAYYYWKGINLFAFLAIAVGTTVSFLIYNPLTAAIHAESVFRYVGAAMPATLLTALLYYILARVFLVPRKIGFPPIPRG